MKNSQNKRRNHVKRKTDNGFILAFTVVFMALVSTLAGIALLNISYPARLTEMEAQKNREQLSLEKIGRDFAIDGTVDGSCYEYTVECEKSTRLTVTDKESGKKLLVVIMENGEIASWEYGEQ